MEHLSNYTPNFINTSYKKKRKTFTNEEDQALIKLVQEYGTRNWKFISDKIKTRSPRQCRERWNFYLSPNVNISPWTPEEDHILFEKYNTMGPKWSLFCKYFHNRSFNNIKNRWNTIMRKMRILRLDANSVEDFCFCGWLVTKYSTSFKAKENKADKGYEDESKNDCMLDPLYFYQISNLLN